MPGQSFSVYAGHMPVPVSASRRRNIFFLFQLPFRFPVRINRGRAGNLLKISCIAE